MADKSQIESTENKKNAQIWLRLGISLDVPEEQGLKIKNGDDKVLLEVLTAPGKENGEWYIDGDTYIPEAYLDEEPINFELPKTPMSELIQSKLPDQKRLQNETLPVIDMKKLENALNNGGFSGDEAQAIWHTVWDYSGDWLNVYDERFSNQKQPEIKTGDFIDYDNKRWHVDSVNENSIKLTNINPLDNEKEIRATRWKDHIKEYTVVDKSEVDMSTLTPKKQKPSLADRIESGKEKVRIADKNKGEPDKPKNKKKGVDIDG